MAEEKEEEEYIEPPQEYRTEAYEPDSIPVTNDQQLGQVILQTFARISDPDEIEYKKIKRRIPIIGIKTVVDKKGNEKEIEFVEKWDDKEWEIPIRVQPKYHELITDDLARAFLNDSDLSEARDVVTYCKMIKSFANRYDFDLALHYNNFADENNFMIASSGAYKGKRVELAKTNRVESTYRADSTQLLRQAPEKKKKKILGIF